VTPTAVDGADAARAQAGQIADSDELGAGVPAGQLGDERGGESSTHQRERGRELDAAVRAGEPQSGRRAQPVQYAPHRRARRAVDPGPFGQVGDGRRHRPADGQRKSVVVLHQPAVRGAGRDRSRIEGIVLDQHQVDVAGVQSLER